MAVVEFQVRGPLQAKLGRLWEGSEIEMQKMLLGSLKVNGAGHEQANTKKPKLDIREMEEAAVQTDGSNDVTVAGESDEGPKEEA